MEAPKGRKLFDGVVRACVRLENAFVVPNADPLPQLIGQQLNEIAQTHTKKWQLPVCYTTPPDICVGSLLRVWSPNVGASRVSSSAFIESPQALSELTS